MGKREGCDHRRDNSWWLLSPTGVRITRVCDNCKEEKRKLMGRGRLVQRHYTPEFGQE